MLPGWEFDLLRALPQEMARGLYRQACLRVGSELLLTWRYWAVVGLATALMVPSTILVWVIAARLGLGPFGRVALDLAFHLTLGGAGSSPARPSVATADAALRPDRPGR